jgi:glutamyl-tRNA reductase
MNVVLVGANHRTAPLDVRERLFVPAGELAVMLEDLKRVPGVSEGLILSTCNRTELVTCLDDPSGVAGALVEFLSERRGLAAPELERHLYRLRDLEAVRHVFRVASSLDSMVVGEPQILGQVKQAYQASLQRRTLGTVLDGLMRRSFVVAKKVRTRTGIARHPVSVSHVAVELARQIFGSLEGSSVMLLGAGKMGDLSARQLLKEGVDRVLVASRTEERALEAAGRFGGTAIRLESCAARLREVDIVISSTGAPGYVLRRSEVAAGLHGRRGRPLFFIDIAVPRDIDPEVNTLDNVYLYDIDDLKEIVDANRCERRQEAELAESLVEREVAAFHAWMLALDAGTAIASLRERGHLLKDEELKRFLERHRDGLSEAQRRDLEGMLHALVNKLLHEPTVLLKRSLGSVDSARRAEMLRDLSGPLEPPAPGKGRGRGRAPRSD